MRLNRNNQPLKGEQIDAFRQALHNAFFTRDSFKEFLLIQLDRNFEDLTPSADFPTEILNVIRKADEQDWSANLLHGACLWRRQNAALHAFAQKFGLTLFPATDTPLSAEAFFESKVRPLQNDLDPAQWRASLATLEGQVCLIEFPFRGKVRQGTGFLLGPDIVMTNFHVVQEVIRGYIPPERVSFRFDYKMLEDGRTVNDGVTYGLYGVSAEDWLIDYAEYSPLDSQTDTEDAVPDPEHLDYALLRIAGKAGIERIGGEANKDPQAPARGYIAIPMPTPDIFSGMELFILHHPDGKRLKLAPDTDSVLTLNANQTRIRYRTNTACGSSGAPCFSIGWELVALHHAGDPTSDPPRYNQGIPFFTILRLLEQRGKRRFLGSGVSPQLMKSAFEVSATSTAAENTQTVQKTSQAGTSEEPSSGRVAGLTAQAEDQPDGGTPETIGPVRILYSYHGTDQRLMGELKDQFATLRQQGKIEEEDTSKLMVGVERIKTIQQMLDRAGIIIVGISPSYIASKHHYEVELGGAMEQYRRRPGSVVVVPVVLSPLVGLEDLPIKDLVTLPSGPKSLKEDKNAAFYEIAMAITAAVKKKQKRG